ncbi:hypothetical protein ERJ75_001351100 [Trypanosoma vivax]|uniref:J domain-containing protein n=1 Tax=Trypanosoma vivax (strain Y486) TaxID=1055687 RepID=G0UCZ7_TRYVY|nr:hypothetical protein TRVL_07845 [Trypanosoma vivax]KAH8608249.1 hypothetical protein ERJ75_001351100 [Trypanosoma vivax]CCC53707.1 conserved hypothetical protein [Trypanosoma vivax Y486]
MFRLFRLFLAPAATTDDISAAFRVLGLDPNCVNGNNSGATGAEIVRAQYLRLARLHHPDISSGDDQKMKIINTAYEMIQSSGVLNARAVGNTENIAGKEEKGIQSDKGTGRFTPKAGLRRRRVPDNFADGDSWAMKSTLEWSTMMGSVFGVQAVSEEELRNPANHPFSHSKFFTFDEDICIYRMVRGGATVRQVARTLGKPATFVERRLHNAQFRQRVQYVMRHEKRQQKEKTKASSTAAGVNMTERSFGVAPGFQGHAQPYETIPSELQRKREWEPTVPEWDSPTYFSEMTLEEKGRHARLLQEEQRQQQTPSWTRTASKIGQSYRNYMRLSGKGTRS